MSAPINPNLVLVGTVEARRTAGPERRYRITNGSLDNLKPGTYRLFAETSAASGERPTPASALRLARTHIAWQALGERIPGDPPQRAEDVIIAIDLALAAAVAQATEPVGRAEPSDIEEQTVVFLNSSKHPVGTPVYAEPVEARKPLTEHKVDLILSRAIDKIPFSHIHELLTYVAREVERAHGITHEEAGEPQTEESINV
jgi:hypothetical protein